LFLIGKLLSWHNKKANACENFIHCINISMTTTDIFNSMDGKLAFKSLFYFFLFVKVCILHSLADWLGGLGSWELGLVDVGRTHRQGSGWDGRLARLGYLVLEGGAGGRRWDIRPLAGGVCVRVHPSCI
jgi:hypothetical protein